MNAKPPRQFHVRDLRVLMSLATLMLALVTGAAGWVLLLICFPAEGQAAVRVVLAITATAVGAAGGVIVVGRTIRRRPLSVVTDGVEVPGDPGPGDEGKLLSRIINSMEGGVMTISSGGTVTSFNAVAQKTLGCDALHAVGRGYEAVFPSLPVNRLLREMIRSALAARQTYSSVEVNAAGPDGSTVALGVTLTVLRGEDGRPRGVVLTFKDLAELKRIREQVQRTDQLASLGRLAAGMAHEIRNPLGSLSGLVELIREDFAPDDPRLRYTDTILRTISQLNTLVENLLDFSQPLVSALEPHGLRDIVRECVQLCAFEHRGRSVTVLEDYETAATVMADRETLARAVVNIVRNAFQATPEGGTITVSVREEPPKRAGKPGQAAIRVTNTGSYVRPEDRGKLFTPFFTTKSGGAGLGLPIANQIISAHSGQIDVQSEPDSGTTFTILLPLAAVAAATAV